MGERLNYLFMIEKILLYQNEIVLEFDDQKHQYLVNNKVVPSVTTITSITAKPQLIYWAVNQTIDYIKNNIKPGVIYDEIQILNFLKEAKKKHTEVKNNAAEIGTLVHGWLCKYITAKINGTPEPPPPINKEMQSAVNGFLLWEKENNVQWLISERKVYSKKYNFAGTLDAEAIVNNNLAIIDFKTSNHFHNEYLMQAFAYLEARKEENPEGNYKEVHILRLSKENELQKIKGFEVVSSNDFDLHIQAFLACLHLFQWQEKMKDKEMQDLLEVSENVDKSD